MDSQPATNWGRMLRIYRHREGLSQAELAGRLGVDQTSVSRWERGVDAPRPAARARLRVLMRAPSLARQDAAVIARVRYAAWPASLVSKGAVFLEINASAINEAGLAGELRGASIYGRFGDETDDVTARWEKTGIFSGDVAATISINAIQEAGGKSRYIRTMDTPHFTRDGEIWCLCEIQRIDRRRYQSLRRSYGGPIQVIPFS